MKNSYHFNHLSLFTLISYTFVPLLLLACTSAFAQTAVAPSGSGTASDPYQIATLSNLYWVTQNSSSWGSYFKQTADIDASADTTWSLGAGFTPIGGGGTSFTGLYDGGGHTISGLYISRSGTQNIDMFGYTQATIRNIGLVNENISGYINVGGLIGGTDYSSVSNCYTTGSVSGNGFVGGLVGYASSDGSNSLITNSYSTASVSVITVSGSGGFGGLVGLNTYIFGGSASITDSYSTGRVNAGSGSLYVGGLVGENDLGTVTNSFWDATTSGKGGSAGGTGEPTDSMKTESTFTSRGWDFDSTWAIGTSMNNGYPGLLWQAGYTAPPAPTLASPANNATNLPTTDTLRVISATGAEGYSWQVSPSAAFSSFIYYDSTAGIGDTVHVVNLTNGTRYYWRVFAYNSIGASPFAGPDSFTTIVAAPPAPVLASPANRSTDLSPQLVLEVMSASGASGYRWQVSLNSVFSPNVIDDSTSGIGDTANSVALIPARKYYWRVLAYNVGGQSAYASPDSFTTMAVSGHPELVYPPDNAQDILADTAVFKWNPGYYATSYIFQLSKSSSFSSYVVNDSNIVDTSEIATGLTNLTKYYWRVSANNLSGTSIFGVDSFTTVPAPPASPALAFPGNGAMSQPANTTLKIDAASGASGYHWQISVDSSFASMVLNDSTNGAGDTAHVVALANGKLYYWRVQAYNIGGGSPYAGPDSFATVVGAPSAPTLASPMNNAANQPIELALEIDPTGNATGYNWQVSTDPAFQSTVVNDTTSGEGDTAQVVNLQNNTKYYWRVEAFSVSGASGFASTDSFTTIIGIPTCVWPPANASNLPAILTLKINPEGGAAGYQWQVSTSPTFSTMIINDSTRSAGDTLMSATFVAGIKYYWRVRAYGTYGANSFSGIDSFTVMTAPAAPLLASPANNSASQRADSLILKWNRVDADSGYICEVSTTPSFTSSLAVKDTTRDTTLEVSSLKNLTKYYWRVSAYNAGGMGAYSSVDSFTTIIAVPSAPTLASPVGATGEPRRATLQWRPSIDAKTYHLQVATADSVDSLGGFLGAYVAFDTTVSDTAVRVWTPLAAKTEYYWHVNAADTGGTSGYSVTASFTTGTGVDGIDDVTGAPKSYALYQNYPNPFNPSTTISFDLKEPSMVTLQIYNVLGQSVAHWNYGMMNAGRYDKEVNLSEFASGVYFYRLQVVGMKGERFVSVKRMMMLK